MKKSKIFRAACLLLCAAALPLMATACGSGNSGATTAAPTAAGTTFPATTAIPATTLPPVTTIPPTTLAPFVPDSSQSYFDQMSAEFAYYGFTGGDLIAGPDEDSVLGKAAHTGVSLADIDLTGANVPFSVAKEVTVAKATTNFWDVSLSKSFDKSFSITAGDIVAGCLWVKEGSNGDPAMNPAECYIAVKTSDDNYQTDYTGSLLQDISATGDWTKIYFYAEMGVDDAAASKATMFIFLGYGPQVVDIGGWFIERFPGNDANYAALVNFPA